MTATYSVPPNKESTKPKEKMGLVSRRRLVVSDFIMSFMWVWSSVLIKMFVHTILGYGAHDLKGDILKHAISVINMFFFAFLVKATKGGAYNPLTILSGAISGDLTNFIFTVAARIPAQILLEAETNSIKSSRCFSFNATGTVQRSRKAKTKLPVISHKSPQSRLPLPEQNYPLQRVRIDLSNHFMVSESDKLLSSTMTNPSIATSIASSQNMTTGLSNNFTHSNLIKSDRNIYVLWRSQILSALRGHDLEGYIDGTQDCPSKFVANSSLEGKSSEEITVSPAYTTWRRQDQLLLSWLLSSLTGNVLGKVVRCATTKVWHALETMFASQSKARLMQLRLQLQTTKKGTLSMTDRR
ncbi:uncharacterized protein LOC107878073 isoform X1 [Capsicum annuum]|uniref:uncharacterized protein LOC107878073 isoform X1 n=1 Tax=Capsicum annuum TaxID=4072 RepID=UPI001FB0BA48|nr:uncharacterized protein LOC107878073 isoform X1 [Capsicum annuum]